MKIEIDIPELDKNEWEYLGECRLEKGDRYAFPCSGGWGVSEWTIDSKSELRWHCFRKKENCKGEANEN